MRCKDVNEFLDADENPAHVIRGLSEDADLDQAISKINNLIFAVDILIKNEDANRIGTDQIFKRLGKLEEKISQ